MEEEDYKYNYSSSDDDCYFSDRDFLDYELQSEEDDDDDNDSEFSLQSGCPSTIKVITKESLLAAQGEDLRRVMDILTLTEQHARTLLIHHRWDIDKLFAVLVEKGKDWLFAEAGVIVVERKNLASLLSSSTITCNICMEDFCSNEVTTMDCGHYFCNNCWIEHFTVNINEGQSRRIRCMAHECNTICDEAIIRNLVSAKDFNLAERFQCFLLESYIEDNRKVKWCPSVPHCGNAIRVEDDEYCEVECLCGLLFCFRCSSEVHSPCSCLMWKLWTTQTWQESQTVNWITINTMPCPKCDRAVEKNGGCNLMRCICGQTFCWMCGGATGGAHTWQNIEGHTCGRPEGVKIPEHTKKTLDRHLHYHNLYKAHIVSFKLVPHLKETINTKLSILERKESAVQDFSWVTNGICRLFISRRVLTYSYPFAFYMFGDDLFKDEMTKVEKELKEHQFQVMQQRLQANVEKLSKLLEYSFHVYSKDQVMEMRIKVTNLSVITDRLCTEMYEFIENDLLGSLQMEIHSIAPYRSNGVERASEIPIWNSKSNNFNSIQPSLSTITSADSLNGSRASCDVRERRGHMPCIGEERIECHQQPSSGSPSLERRGRRSLGRMLKKMLMEIASSISTCRGGE